MGMNIIVHSLFNIQLTKFRKSQQIRHRKRFEKAVIEKMVDSSRIHALKLQTY